MTDFFTQTIGTNDVLPHERLLLLANGFVLSQCIFAATELGIADLLAAGPQSCDQLAADTQTHRDSLYRLLRLLADLDIFAEAELGVFRNTPMSECLQDKDSFGVVRHFILLRRQEVMPWTALEHSIHTGRSAFEQMYGMPRYEYLRQNPEVNGLFDRAMAELAALHNRAIVAAYDFSGAVRVMDIAGGQGGLLAMLLEQYPHIQGVLFDQAGVVEKARQHLQNRGLLERCEPVAGDFFQQVPAGGDIYLLKHILHNWDDTQSVRILRTIRQVMRSTTKLLIIERAMNPDSSLRSKMLDLNMLVMLATGKVRSDTEFTDLLMQAGFRVQRVLPTESELYIIEAMPD